MTSCPSGHSQCSTDAALCPLVEETGVWHVGSIFRFLRYLLPPDCRCGTHKSTRSAVWRFLEARHGSHASRFILAVRPIESSQALTAGGLKCRMQRKSPRQKLTKYGAGDRMAPLIIEAHGRLGQSAAAWLQKPHTGVSAKKARAGQSNAVAHAVVQSHTQQRSWRAQAADVHTTSLEPVPNRHTNTTGMFAVAVLQSALHGQHLSRIIPALPPRQHWTNTSHTVSHNASHTDE